MTYAQKHLGTPSGMSLIELQETCSALMIGGSETTASLLSGVIYYLLKNPTKLEKLNQEIRSAFRTEDDIDIVSTKRLTYQAAVVEESMRIFSPLPQQIQRVTSPEGNMIAGRFVPGGTKVGVTHWPAYHSSLNFKDPYDFVPERWLGDEKYKDDRRDVLNPFSYGPRNCIGINLAYAEINLVLARLLWTFDTELRPECNDWVRGMPVWAVYQRPPLWINLLPVVRD
jgi:cytochrome P450